MNAIKGGLVAIASSLLIAILFAYSFRLPIPLGGYIDPFGTIAPGDHDVMEILKIVTGTWVFYGVVLGGYIVLFAGGAAVGAWVDGRYSTSSRMNGLILVGGSVAGIVCVFLLSIPDYLVGPWWQGIMRVPQSSD